MRCIKTLLRATRCMMRVLPAIIALSAVMYRVMALPQPVMCSVSRTQPWRRNGQHGQRYPVRPASCFRMEALLSQNGLTTVCTSMLSKEQAAIVSITGIAVTMGKVGQVLALFLPHRGEHCVKALVVRAITMF